MRYFYHFSLWILLASTPLFAGEYADAFLLANIHPQIYALGNSAVAANVTAGHALNNPAGFVNGPAGYVSLIYQQFEDLTQSVGLEAKYGILDKYDLGLTIVNNTIDGLYARPDLSQLSPQTRRDSVFALSQSSYDLIHYRESAVFLSIAREYKFDIDLGWVFFKIPCRLPVGASLKYIDKILVANRGVGSGLDAGAQFFFNLGGMTDYLVNTEFSVGLMLSDMLNTPVYWDTEHQDAIKRHFTYGYAMTQNLKKLDTVIGLSRSRQSRYENIYQYGVEVRIKDKIYIRGGHDGYTSSFGLGIGLKKVIIDYSFSQHELSDMQKIGISYHF